MRIWIEYEYGNPKWIWLKTFWRGWFLLATIRAKRSEDDDFTLRVESTIPEADIPPWWTGGSI